MNDLPRSQQPRSEAPEFWSVWVGTDEEGKPIPRDTDWAWVANDWQARSTDANEGDE